MRNRAWFLVLFAVACLVVACGGGGGFESKCRQVADMVYSGVQEYCESETCCMCECVSRGTYWLGPECDCGDPIDEKYEIGKGPSPDDPDTKVEICYFTIIPVASDEAGLDECLDDKAECRLNITQFASDSCY
jgi:hypothetical protein